MKNWIPVPRDIKWALNCVLAVIDLIGRTAFFEEAQDAIKQAEELELMKLKAEE